jgi:fatty-acyl-CoA synthase
MKRPGVVVSNDDILQFCRERIAHFKCPREIAFGDLPKTATGKIQKYVLREQEWKGYEKRIN